MRSEKTFRLLTQLAGKPGKKDKLALLQTADDFDRDVFRRVLDPFITYGIASLQIPQATGLNGFEEATFNLLDRLASRALTGLAAREALTMHMRMLLPGSQQLLHRIITKDLKCGVKEALINEVFPGLIPVFGMQLSEVYDPSKVKSWPVWVEPKYDGLRAILVMLPGDTSPARFYSKNGLPFETLDGLAQEIRHAHGFVNEPVMLDGEVTSGQFNDTVSQVKRKKARANDAVFNVFDYFYTGGHASEMKFRREDLETRMPFDKVPRMVLAPGAWCNNDAEVRAAAQKIWNIGGEGVIVKDPDAGYALKRSYNWMKLKKLESAEFRVRSVFPGTGKNARRAGGVVVDVGGVECRVSGFTEAALDALWAERDTVAGRWLEVEFHEHTPAGSLRHPRAVKFRDTNTGGIE